MFDNIKAWCLALVLTLVASLSTSANQTNEVKCEKTTASSVESKSYYLNICGVGTKDDPMIFVLTSKKGLTKILPFNQKNLLGDIVLRNGNLEYRLKYKKLPYNPNLGYAESIPVRLVIKKNGAIIIDEPVVKDRSGYWALP